MTFTLDSPTEPHEYIEQYFADNEEEEEERVAETDKEEAPHSSVVFIGFQVFSSRFSVPEHVPRTARPSQKFISNCN